MLRKKKQFSKRRTDQPTPYYSYGNARTLLKAKKSKERKEERRKSIQRRKERKDLEKWGRGEAA